MYEAYDSATGELKRVDIYELQQGLADDSLSSEKPAEKKPRAKKVTADENQG